MKNFSTIINDKDIITVEYQKNKSVLFSESQTLTDAQKSQARSNIGAGTVSGVQINGSTKGTSGVVDLGYMQVRVNGTTYTADSSGLIDLGTISGGGSASTSQYNDIY